MNTAKTLSAIGSPLPPLALRCLTPNAAQALDSDLLAHPKAFIASSFWSITHVLRDILDNLPLASTGSYKDADIQQSTLGQTELLMHKLSSLHESLVKTVAALTGNQGSRSIRRLRDDLEAIIDRQFKIPVNLIKHANHTLHWLEATGGSERIAGFVVNGLIEQGVAGPANYSIKPKPVAEGYSYPKLLRDAMSSIYSMCAIAEDALWKAGALDPEQPTDAQWHAGDQAKVNELLDALNQLPHRCFPNEHGDMVSEFSLVGDSVTEPRKWKLHQFSHYRLTYSLPRVEKGSTYKMPYWVKPDPVPTGWA